jgi:hypothetical protein
MPGGQNESLTVTVAKSNFVPGLLTMSKTRLLRFAIWASVVSAALFQTAFLVELHGPLPSDLTLCSFSALSVACVAVVLFARRSLATKAKISYTPERVSRRPRSDAGAEHRVQRVYRVILCRQPLVPMHYPRTKSFYLSEGSAVGAVTTASMENPQWRAIGVEPPNLSARRPQSDRSHSRSHTGHVA